jgi:hypothetical protein
MGLNRICSERLRRTRLSRINLGRQSSNHTEQRGEEFFGSFSVEVNEFEVPLQLPGFPDIIFECWRGVSLRSRVRLCSFMARLSRCPEPWLGPECC